MSALNDKLASRALLSVEMWAEVMEHLELTPRRRCTAALTSLMRSLHPSQVGLFLVLSTADLPNAQLLARLLSVQEIVEAFQRHLGLSGPEVLAEADRQGGLQHLAQVLEPTGENLPAVSAEQLMVKLGQLEGERLQPVSLLDWLFRAFSPTALRFLLQMFLSIPPLKLGHQELLEALAAVTGVPQDELRRCYHLTHSFDEVGSRAVQGRRAVAQVHCRTGRPFHMMRHQVLTPAYSSEQAQDSERVLEALPGGVRVQLHRRHGAVQMFGEGLSELTRSFPDVTGPLERALLGTDDLILEGWLHALDGPAEGSARLVQSRLARLRQGLPPDPDAPPLRISLVELLRKGREDLMSRPFHERHARVKSVCRLNDRVVQATVQPAVQPAVQPTVQPTVQPAVQPTVQPGVQTRLSRVPPLENGESRAGVDPLRSAGVLERWAGQAYDSGNAVLPGYVPARGDTLCLGVSGAVVGKRSRINRLVLACLCDGRLEPVGELSERHSDHSLWQELMPLIEARVMATDGGSLSLLPGLVIEVHYEAIRVPVRKTTLPSVAGIRPLSLRCDLGLQQVTTARGLVDRATRYADCFSSSQVPVWSQDAEAASAEVPPRLRSSNGAHSEAQEHPDAEVDSTSAIRDEPSYGDRLGLP